MIKNMVEKLGTRKKLGEFLGVNRQTLYNWEANMPKSIKQYLNLVKYTIEKEGIEKTRKILKGEINGKANNQRKRS